MISALFNQPNYLATKKLMDATVLRHEAIAQNLANIETPRYRRVEVDGTFKQQLQQALAAQDKAQMEGLQPVLKTDLHAVAVRRDGNNVQLESELLALNQNTVAHALETQLISGSLARMRLAITGRT